MNNKIKNLLLPILIIIKKEIKAYFDHPVAYIILVVFLAVNSFFFFQSSFITNVADLRSMFSILPWLFLFIVPAITMRLLAEEKQNETLELLFVQPIYEWQILIGKFFGGLIFILIGLLLTLPIPLLLLSHGQFDGGMILAQYLGATLLGAITISVGLLASSSTKNQIISFMFSVVIIFVLIIIGFNVVLVSMPGFIKNILEQLSISWHYSNIIRGVIDLRDIIYFITITASFLAISYWLIIKDKVNTSRAIWRQLKIGIGILISIAIIINLLGLNIHGRYDLTKQKLYTLSPATKNIVGNLNDVITIDLYNSKELPPEVSLRARDVSDLLNDYQIASNGKLKINIHEVDTDNANKAETVGIQPVQFNSVSSDELQVKKGYFGLKISYLDQKEVIPFIESSDNLEYQVTRLIRKMTVTNKMTVGFLTGHGEKSKSSDYKTFSQNLNEQYNLTEVTIDGEKGEMDVTPDILIVAGPNTEMTANEQDVLRNYMNSGGKVLFLIDTIAIDMQTLQVTPNINSLADLVGEYGVHLNTDVAGDLRSHESISLSNGGYGSYVLPYPLWPQVTGNDQSPITTDINTLAMPWTSTLTANDDHKEATPLLLTTDAGFIISGEQINLLPNQDFNVYNNDLKQQVLGMSVTNKKIDEQSSDNDFRMVVIGDSDFITDNFASSNPSATLFALNAVDWLSQDIQLIGVRSKQRQASVLVFEKDGQKNTIKYFNLIGLPILVAGFGFFYLYKRKKRTTRKYSKN